MHKIGHQTLFLPTSEHNPRNGESTFARLADGRIMMAYTEYYGTDREDHATARISAVYSADEGETWTEPKLCLPDHGYYVTNNDRVVRLSNGRLILPANLHVRNENGEPTDVGTAHFFLSDDDGESWPHKVCIDERSAISYPDVDFYDGKIYLTYDRERTGAKEIFFSVFTEDDIINGRPIDVKIVSKPGLTSI